MIAALFCNNPSIYDFIPGIDTWSKDRDARNFRGGMPVIAHPPCRSWGSLRFFAKPEPGEKELAFFAIDQVQKNGGVLEHPFRSRLWWDHYLPLPGCSDKYGFTISVPLYWFGFDAQKPTNFYVCGIRPRDLPEVPMRLGRAPNTIGTRIRVHEAKYEGHRRKQISKKDFSRTPVLCALWLREIAERCAA